MHRLIKGMQRFQNQYYVRHKEHIDTLINGQSPHTLFVTCSDSRICPTKMTDVGLGELFVIRNAGNLIPHAHGPLGQGHEALTLEYGVEQLGIKEIVICGHESCGAMAGVLNPEAIGHLPITQKKVQELARLYSDAPSFLVPFDESERLSFITKLNILYQLKNLLSYSFIKKKFLAGELEIFGWIFSLSDADLSFAVDLRELCLDQECAEFMVATHSRPHQAERSV